MKSKTVNIIGPLSPELGAIDPEVFTIFVDGGLDHASAAFKNAVSIGDGDSTGKPMDIVLSRDKDRGDLHFAIMESLKRGANKAKLYGFIGGRLDHQILLLGDLLALSQEEHLCFEIYEKERLRMEILPSGEHEFDYKGAFSVFTHTEQKILYQGDCKYPIKKEYPQLLKPFSTKGISNYSSSKFALKSEGSLCVFFFE